MLAFIPRTVTAKVLVLAMGADGGAPALPALAFPTIVLTFFACLRVRERRHPAWPARLPGSAGAARLAGGSTRHGHATVGAKSFRAKTQSNAEFRFRAPALKPFI